MRSATAAALLRRLAECGLDLDLDIYFSGDPEGEPVAELRPVPSGRRLGELPELLASLPRLSPDDASALGEDIEAARRELNEHPPHGP